MALLHKPGTTWNDVYLRARMAAPEAFDTHRIANLIGGEWSFVGETKPHPLAIDGSHIPGPPRISREIAITAVEHAARQDGEWSKVLDFPTFSGHTIRNRLGLRPNNLLSDLFD